MTSKQSAYNYALKVYSNNSIKDLQTAVLSFQNCDRWREDTEYNKGLREGIEYLINHKYKQMAKYVNTKDSSLGAKLLGNGKALVAREVNGKKVVEIIDQASDILDEALPIVQKILNQLIDFFNSVFHRFPTVIVIDGVNFVYTQQPAPFKAIDRLFYMSVEDANDTFFMHEGKNMAEAKRGLRKELKELGYMS